MTGMRAAIIFAVGLLGGWLANHAGAFLRIDTCLDSGGAWNYNSRECRHK